MPLGDRQARLSGEERANFRPKGRSEEESFELLKPKIPLQSSLPNVIIYPKGGERMRENEFLTHYNIGNASGGFHLRTYDSIVNFKHRDFFEHRHIDFEISLIVEGSGVYRFRDGDCRFHVGDVFVMGSNQIHCVTDIDGDRPLQIFNIQFESRLFWASNKSLLNEKHLGIFNNQCRRFCANTAMAKALGERILALRQQTIAQESGYEILIYADLISLIGTLVRECGQPDVEIASSNRSFTRIEEAMRYMDLHIADKLTLEEIANIAGYSRNYFCALFTQLNGLSPWDYIMIKRINMSKGLLESTDDPITEIALRCGYQTITIFNRHFKRLVGYTPTEYARTHKNRNIV